MSLLLLGAGVKEVFDHSKLAVSAYEGALQSFAPQGPGPARGDPESMEELDRLRLAFQEVCAGLGVRDRGLGRTLGRFADEHRAGLGDGLNPGSGVHEIARDHSLAFGAERDRRFAGEYAGSR